MRTFFFGLFLIIFFASLSCGIYDGLNYFFSDSSTSNAASFVKWVFLGIFAFGVLWLMENARKAPERERAERFEHELTQGKHHLK